MALPNWSKWVIVLVPVIAAIVFLVWWFFFRTPSCKEGFVWDPVLKDCVPGPDTGPAPAPGPGPGPGKAPYNKMVLFDQTNPVPPNNIWIPGGSWLVAMWDEDPDLGWPTVQVVTGSYRSRNLIEGGARLGGFAKNPKARILGLTPENVWVAVSAADVGTTDVGADRDNAITGVPGIKLKQLAIYDDVVVSGDDALGYWLNVFALSGHREFAYPLRTQGTVNLHYGA